MRNFNDSYHMSEYEDPFVLDAKYYCTGFKSWCSVYNSTYYKNLRFKIRNQGLLLTGTL